jgi:hypothetical protein
MFGIENPGIYLAYLMVFLCTAFAILFGIINWNKGKITPEELKDDLEWEEKEEKFKKEISD